MTRQRMFDKLCATVDVTKSDMTEGGKERFERAQSALAMYVWQNRAHVTIASDAPTTTVCDACKMRSRGGYCANPSCDVGRVNLAKGGNA